MGEEHTLLPASKSFNLSSLTVNSTSFTKENSHFLLLQNYDLFCVFEASVQRSNYPPGRIVERVVRADGRAMEFPRGRIHPGARGYAVGAKGESRRQGEKIERTFSEMRRAQSRSLGVRVLKGHSSLQGG